MNYSITRKINLPLILVTLLTIGLSATSFVFLHNFLHIELRIIDSNHILIGSTTIIVVLTLLLSLFAHTKSLSLEVKETNFELSQVCKDNVFFRLLSEKSNDMIHLNDEKGAIEYANPITFDLLGFEHDEFVGRPAADFIHPEDRELISKDMGLLAQGRVKDVSPRAIRLLKKDGTYLDVEVKGFTLNNDDEQIYLGAILRDITNRKKREQLLKAKEEWEQAFDTMADFVSVHDSDFRVIKANNALCNFIGKTREEVIGSHCYQLFHATDKPHTDCPHVKAGKSGQAITETIYDNNYKDIPLQITCSPFFDENGTFQGTVHIARVQELSNKMDTNQTMSICASCKDIRTSDNEWTNIEHFILDNFGTQFTHSICTKCRNKLYPEYIKD